MDKTLSDSYKIFHPRWYRRRVPIFWWTRQLSYVKFISRELTSLAVGYAAVLLIAQLCAAGSGEETYEHFQALLAAPPMVAVHVVVFAALLFHTFTWLHLAPQAMVLYVGRRRVPASLVLLAHYGAWLGASVLVFWLLLGGAA